jgi:hypothetical protein
MSGKIYGFCPDSDDVNTGTAECGVQPDVPSAILICDPSARYSTDPAEFNEALHDFIIAQDVTKILPVAIADSTTTGGDWKTRTVGDVQKTIGHTQKIEVFVVNDPDLCLYKEISKTNGWKVRVFRAYRNRMIDGTTLVEGDTTSFAGYAATVYSREVRDTANGYSIEVQVTYDINNEYEEKNMQVFQLDAIPEGLVGASLVAGTAAGTANIVTSCGQIDLGKKWATKWVPTAFIDDTGANPATASVNPTTGVLTIAPAGNYRVAPAIVLDPLGIIGINGTADFATITAAP